jgi:hypothetical protein
MRSLIIEPSGVKGLYKGKSAKRYARLLKRVRMGVVGRDFQRFRGVLTTRVGDDNRSKYTMED